MSSFQSIALRIVRALGGFTLVQYLTRNRLRILCYHGFSAGDEHALMPYMFMRASTFERRMRILEKRGVPVIPLDEAVKRLQTGDIKNSETVITLDDGWTTNLTIGAPILEKHGFPACIYVTTEHLSAGTEVFNVLLNYMIRSSGRDTLRLEGLHPDMDGVYELRRDPSGVTVSLIIAAEKAFPSLRDRQSLLTPIAAALDVDLAKVLTADRFRLLDRDQIRELSERGFDIQLHTHTHRLPDQSFESMAPEIERNRAHLQSIVGPGRDHFCFPSGRYSPRHPAWLARLGIQSATTCDSGLNASGTSNLLLKRYLDSDHLTDLQFEAIICGFHDMARNARAILNRLRTIRLRDAVTMKTE